MTGILPQIGHIIVVMLENRSFDNMCGWPYRDAPEPSLYLAASSSPRSFDGLDAGLFNPVEESYFTNGSGQEYPVFDRANATNMPNPDLEEDFPYRHIPDTNLGREAGRTP
jgi:phospholipase C